MPHASWSASIPRVADPLRSACRSTALPQGSIALLYVLSGLFGTCVSIIFLPGVTSVGASGSLFGLIGAQVGGSPHHLRLLSLPTLQSPLLAHRRFTTSAAPLMARSGRTS